MLKTWGYDSVQITDVKSETSIPWSSLVAIQPNGSKPPFFCVHGLGGEVLRFRQLAVHLGIESTILWTTTTRVRWKTASLYPN